MVTDILIGGTGFIGSVLSERLEQEGQSVLAIGHQASGRKTPYRELTLNLATEELPSRIFDDRPTVYLLIGQTGPGFDAQIELQLLESILKQCQHRVQRLFFFSTTLVYGECSNPATEQTPPRPIGSYPTYKATAEQLVNRYIPPDAHTILRLGNVYGSPKNRGFINFVLQSHLTSPSAELTLTNHGNIFRDYLFLDDLVQAVISLRMNPSSHGTINIATGQSHSLNEVVAAIEAITGREAPIVRQADLPTEAQTILIDINRLRRLTGFRPTPLSEGLAMTYARYLEEYAHATH